MLEKDDRLKIVLHKDGTGKVMENNVYRPATPEEVENFKSAWPAWALKAAGLETDDG